MRGEQVENRRRLEQLQWSTFIFQMCRPVINRWLDTVALAGIVKMPGYAANPRLYRQVKHIVPKWEWVDPMKDRQAEQLAVKERWKSRSDVVEAEGFDVEEVDERIKADQDREEAMGIEVPRPEPLKAGAPAAETGESEPESAPKKPQKPDSEDEEAA
jgi:capsid protein